MNKELDALDQNETWEMTQLPKRKKAIGSRWVYKTKYASDEKVERLKARVVARGDRQIKGKDYKHTFSPVAKFATVRALIALATAKKWELNQLDINNAFLHGYLEEEVYMKPPPGYNKGKPGEVCNLKRSIYGLKQASRQWNLELCKLLKRLEFDQAMRYYSLFSKVKDGKWTIVLVYVDDLLVTGDDIDYIKILKQELDREFTIKDPGLMRYYFGIELLRNKDRTILNQRKYI